MKDTVYGLVSDDLGIDTLENLCVSGGIQTGPFGSQLHQKDYLPVGTPIITVEHLGENRVLHQDLPRVSNEDKDRLSRYVMSKGDIIFSRVGSVDRRALVRDDEDGWLFSGRCLRVRPDNKKIDSEYLSWFFGLEIFKDYIRRIAVGATMPSLNTELLSNVPVIFPPLPEQRAIAGILGALDDKIELNRRMNRTLESLARAVFRQWFVENEEVGSWEVGRLGDVITNFDSKRVPVANRERAQRQGKYPYYGAASVMDYVDDYLFDGIYVLMGEDGSVVDDEGHPVIQYVWGKIWVNNHAHVLQGINGICNEHLYLFLKDVNILPYITGAVQPKINQANMNSIPFPLPPMELRKKFEEFVSPLFAKIRANDEESRTLASLRDALLPKLMRGEVRVKGT